MKKKEEQNKGRRTRREKKVSFVVLQTTKVIFTGISRIHTSPSWENADARPLRRLLARAASGTWGAVTVTRLPGLSLDV